MDFSRGARILYVDDNKDSCEVIGLMLYHADESWAVTAVTTTDSAIALMESLKIDLYILDYQFPESSGIELCRRIRHTDQTVPILFFSAMARPIDRETAFAAGANEYLVKPNDLMLLTKTVKRLLQHHLSFVHFDEKTSRKSNNVGKNGLW